MFYVTGTKVYLTSFNKKLNIYPEVKLVKESADGRIVFDVLSTGVSSKPVHREICTAEEVLARFGASASMRSKRVEKAKE